MQVAKKLQEILSYFYAI